MKLKLLLFLLLSMSCSQIKRSFKSNQTLRSMNIKVFEELTLNNVSVSKNSRFLVQREIYNAILTYYYIEENKIYAVYVNSKEVLGLKKLERTSGLYHALFCVFNNCHDVENYFLEENSDCGYLFWLKMNGLRMISKEVLYDGKCFSY